MSKQTDRESRAPPEAIYFCPGSKADLEEITGHHYLYAGIACGPGFPSPRRNIVNQFIEGYGKSMRAARNNLYDRVKREGVDAVVNYSGPYIADGREGHPTLYVVYGILVRRVGPGRQV